MLLLDRNHFVTAVLCIFFNLKKTFDCVMSTLSKSHEMNVASDTIEIDRNNDNTLNQLDYIKYLLSHSADVTSGIFIFLLYTNFT